MPRLHPEADPFFPTLLKDALILLASIYTACALADEILKVSPNDNRGVKVAILGSLIILIGSYASYRLVRNVNRAMEANEAYQARLFSQPRAESQNLNAHPGVLTTNNNMSNK